MTQKQTRDGWIIFSLRNFSNFKGRGVREREDVALASEYDEGGELI